MNLFYNKLFSSTFYTLFIRSNVYKNKKHQLITSDFLLVRVNGVDPPHDCSLYHKSGASANSATPAYLLVEQNLIRNKYLITFDILGINIKDIDFNSIYFYNH